MKQIHFPGGFIVGHDILKDFVSYGASFGKKMAFIGGQRALKAAEDKLRESFKGSDCQCTFVTCGSLATLSEIERVSQIPEVVEADVLCGLGGGSCMDIVRTVGNRQKKPLIMIPTTASSDAPCSRVSVFYAEDGSHIIGDQVHLKGPELVVVDTELIAKAPARHLASGMGDAIATIYEATTCKNGTAGGRITETAMMMAKLCYNIIMEDGMNAYASVLKKESSPALERVIEANCFLSGVGGTNTGCAAGHGIGDYLCMISDGHSFMHGERVYIGLMVQLILEGYPMDELLSLMSFGKAVGLPLSISDIGVTNVEETAMELAKALQDDHFMQNLTCDYSENVLANAICLADQLAQKIYKGE